MLLFNNKFNDNREIKGFTKDEILDVKRKLTRFKQGNVEESEINDYLKNTKSFIRNILLK
ncbi:MAG: hypothetical protein ACTSPN_10255 [Promethearchaeota archaeon]